MAGTKESPQSHAPSLMVNRSQWESPGNVSQMDECTGCKKSGLSIKLAGTAGRTRSKDVTWARQLAPSLTSANATYHLAGQGALCPHRLPLQTECYQASSSSYSPASRELTGSGRGTEPRMIWTVMTLPLLRGCFWIMCMRYIC